MYTDRRPEHLETFTRKLYDPALIFGSRNIRHGTHAAIKMLRLQGMHYYEYQ